MQRDGDSPGPCVLLTPAEAGGAPASSPTGKAGAWGFVCIASDSLGEQSSLKAFDVVFANFILFYRVLPGIS